MVNILKFNDTFSDIEKPINYWKSSFDIPKNIMKFISETSDSIVIFDEKTKKYYCPKCIKEITKQHKCKHCLTKFDLNKKLNINNIEKIEYCTNNIFYYAFDITDDSVLLYLIHEYVEYSSLLRNSSCKRSKLSIDAIYKILPTEVINLKNNKHISYKKIEELITKFEIKNEMLTDEDYDIYEEFVLNCPIYQYLYPDNLDDLKNTKLYKYSNIWLLKDYFNNNLFCLSSLTFYPVYYKEFEYLIKFKLYNLAIDSCSIIKYKGSFKNTFGIEKEFYPFMKQININYLQLEALQLYPTTDVDMLNFISHNIEIAKIILKYTSIDKFLEYSYSQNLNIKNLYEYGDYIEKCKKMKLDFKNSSVLFPKNFIMQYNKITNDVILANDPNIDKRIKMLSNILMLNKYEDDKYVIFPADSVSSLIDESSQQSNCVRTYCDAVSNNDCQIYFMRYKDNIKKSFVTIEVRNNCVVQAKVKYNEEPPIEVINIIKRWEQTLIPIVNSI